MLGLPGSADSDAVARAYRVKLREAGKDDAAKQRIESAHSSIMMAALTSRLKARPQRRPKLSCTPRPAIGSHLIAAFPAGRRTCGIKRDKVCRQSPVLSLASKVNTSHLVDEAEVVAAAFQCVVHWQSPCFADAGDTMPAGTLSSLLEPLMRSSWRGLCFHL